MIVGRLRDEGLDARIVRDGKRSPGAWMYVGHDPFEPMSVVVPEHELGNAREVLDLDLEEPSADHAAAPRRVLIGRALIWLVAVVLVATLLRFQLGNILPFVEP